MLPPQLSTSKISPMTSQQIAAIAARNTEKARRIIRDTGIIDIWESAGAEINLVGSLSTGLFMKHRDIDFHIYSAVLRPEDDFTALAKLAANPAVKRIEYGNLLATEERCLEWHAWYEDQEGELWQLDMIHIEKGSRYDGYFEIGLKPWDMAAGALIAQEAGAVVTGVDGDDWTRLVLAGSPAVVESLGRLLRAPSA